MTRAAATECTAGHPSTGAQPVGAQENGPSGGWGNSMFFDSCVRSTP